MTILDEIVANKRKEVSAAKKRLPLTLLKDRLLKTNFPARAVEKNGRLQLIAEIKPKSPSAGLIGKNIDPGSLAKNFQSRGASAISVLTDKKYFGGSLQNLSKARKNSGLPILRKEFIFDAYQLYESKLFGADLVLLIAAVLNKRIKHFVKLCLSLGLQPLIEVHNLQELKNVLKLVKPSPKIIIGINNRNLKTFKVDVKTSLELINKIPKGFIRISESGIKNIGELKQIFKAGFNGVLIGEGLAVTPGLFDYFKSQ